ncbi:DUF6965 family protein [Mucilaginibacter sp. McL0603]|uniref:DUF6965 family protein n=1 Tax=Mucilaginibacter sp. McL0603 TaxID=3415670 RepID=UPI003CF18C8A
MTDQELIAYFDKKELPQILRIDRATTQYEVKDAVQRNIENIRASPQDHRSRRRLVNIMDALETPYSGPEIPRF